MNEFFDYNEYVMQVKIRDRLDECESELLRLNKEKGRLEYSTDRNKSSITSPDVERKKTRNLFLSWFKKKRKKIQIPNVVDNRLDESLKKIDELTRKIVNLEEEKKQLQSQLHLDFGDEVREDCEILTVNDSDGKSNIPIDSSKEIIVHCTNLFPKNKTIVNSYDGNKTAVTNATYKGVNKIIKCISHRHTVHFTRNGVVESTGDGRGNWEQPKFIIIEPFMIHQDQFVNSGFSDAWIYGNLNLGTNPLLLIRKDEFDKMSKEDLKDFIVIKYDGDYVKCVHNLLFILGIKEHYLDSNDAGHTESLEMDAEYSLNARHISINYLRDNTWNGKDEIKLSEHDLFVMFDLANSKNFSYEITNFCYETLSDLYNKYGVELSFIKFIISFGIFKDGDCYLIKKDDELYESIRLLKGKYNGMSDKEKCKEFEKLFDFAAIKELYDRYVTYEKANEVSNKSPFSLNANITCEELVKFENHNVAQEFFNMLKRKGIEEPEIIVSLCNYGCHIDFYAYSDFYDSDKLCSMGFNIDDVMETSIIHYDIIAENISDLFNQIMEFVDCVRTTRKTNDAAPTDAAVR